MEIITYFYNKKHLIKQQIRASIIEIIEQIEDKEVLENCYSLLYSVLHLQEGNVVAYTAEGTALDSEQYEAEILQALEEAEAGKWIAHSDIRKFIGLK